MALINPQEDKTLYLFEVDHVLYPHKDFMLQIYYLFGQFVEFTESRAIGSDITQFMKERYEAEDVADLPQQVQQKFGLSQDYADNFERLQANGHLPLKLLLFDTIIASFEQLSHAGKHLAILTAGNPVLQLNKLRHIDWQGWDSKIKIYFTDELTFRNLDPFHYIASEFGVDRAAIEYIQER